MSTQNITLALTQTPDLLIEELRQFVLVRGDSAYEVATKNGFVGTEPEWLTSLEVGGGNPIDLSNYTPKDRKLTINGVTHDLSADNNWNIEVSTGGGTVLSGNGLVRMNGTAITYDNMTYSISTHDHSGTYQPVGDYALVSQLHTALALGTTHTTAAFGDHAHAGIYQPVGTYLTGTKVDSFNTRTGAVTLTKTDVEAVLTGVISTHSHVSAGATLTDNTFTGVQTIPNITLPSNGKVLLTVPTTDGHTTGVTTNAFKAGYSSTAVGDLIYLDASSNWQKADMTTSVATYSGLLGIALEVKTSGSALSVALAGSFVYATGLPALTVGAPIYMSTSGTMVVTQPSASNNAIRIVGFAIHADKIYFNPSNDYITHA